MYNNGLPREPKGVFGLCWWCSIDETTHSPFLSSDKRRKRKRKQGDWIFLIRPARIINIGPLFLAVRSRNDDPFVPSQEEWILEVPIEPIHT
jgi:hypothetical protein